MLRLGLGEGLGEGIVHVGYEGNGGFGRGGDDVCSREGGDREEEEEEEGGERMDSADFMSLKERRSKSVSSRVAREDLSPPSL